MSTHSTTSSSLPDIFSHPTHLKFKQGRLFATSISATSEINAPQPLVWQVLVNLETYGDWNPFTTSVCGSLSAGEPVILNVDMPGRSKSVRTEWVNLVNPPHTLCWGMQLIHRSLLVSNRWQSLSLLKDGRTEYRTTNYFSGLLAPLVLALYGNPMQKGFQSVANALKDFVESRQAAS